MRRPGRRSRRGLGAKGDGVVDDTAALQRGLDRICGAEGRPTRGLFLPNGVYRVTRITVSRIDNGVRGVSCVLRTPPNASVPTSAVR